MDADRVHVKECFRDISKVLLAVNRYVGEPVNMKELCNIKPYYRILCGLGNGEIETDVFDYKKTAL